MASLNMEGPFQLNEKSVKTNVSQNKPGNYALGYTKDNVFIVLYVGRSDEQSVCDRIIQHIGENEKYTHFKFSYETDETARFEKECKNYHDFGGSDRLDNKNHPDAPNHSNLKCPFCIENSETL